MDIKNALVTSVFNPNNADQNPSNGFTIAYKREAGWVVMTGTDGRKEVNLFDAQGNNAGSQSATDKNVMMRFPQTPGVYYLSITTNRGKSWHRVVHFKKKAPPKPKKYWALRVLSIRIP
jgi:hypothetical protein